MAASRDLDIQRELKEIRKKLDRLIVREAPGITGAWTPVFAGSTGAGSYTYVTQTGRWQRAGNLVFVQFDIAISAIGSPPTGNMRITGLPVVSGASVAYGPIVLAFISNLDLPASKFAITAAVPPGEFDYISLYTAQDNTGGAFYPAASFTNANCELIGGGYYEID